MTNVPTKSAAIGRQSRRAVRRLASEGDAGALNLMAEDRCHYCDHPVVERTDKEWPHDRRAFDLIVRPNRGGASVPTNMVTACHLCVVLRGSREHLDYGMFAIHRVRRLRHDLPALDAMFETAGLQAEARRVKPFHTGDFPPSNAGSYVRYMAARDPVWADKLRAATHCVYCEIRIQFHDGPPTKMPDYWLSWDHLRLKKHGGPLSLGNLLPCCHFCNNLRGDQEYIAFAIDALHVVRPLRHNLIALAIEFERLGRHRDGKVARSYHATTRAFERQQAERAKQGLPDWRPEWRITALGTGAA